MYNFHRLLYESPSSSSFAVIFCSIAKVVDRHDNGDDKAEQGQDAHEAQE